MPRKEFIASHKKLGLCTKCMNVPEPGFLTCSSCQEKRRELFKRRVARGKCHNCHRPATAGKSRCEVCAIDHSRKHKNLSIAEQQKALDAFAVFDGFCQSCGSSDPVGGRRSRRWNLDHDHATNKFRGILCSRCNKGLAFFQDSIANMEKAIEYLRRHDGGDPRNTGINVGTN
jgi:hypothetical protein